MKYSFPTYDAIVNILSEHRELLDEKLQKLIDGFFKLISEAQDYESTHLNDECYVNYYDDEE